MSSDVGEMGPELPDRVDAALPVISAALDEDANESMRENRFRPRFSPEAMGAQCQRLRELFGNVQEDNETRERAPLQAQPVELK